ncbi:hypothetical protein X777_16396 [Ooceraea biroi]|uniref:Uncharacterized protein n=1 Tax=Ooceraea biroi TaxID=2015173 RepID=A0A026WUK6_OOCBI|nr:hypothetical protein X777_16396 [Ooceraea biroi]
MLSVLRQRFWILGDRNPVSAVARRCIRCTRYRAAAAKELMGQLPASRVTPSRPFLNSGVDYAGPFSLRTWHGRSGRTYKGFLILFVCFSTPAVHIEMATGLLSTWLGIEFPPRSPYLIVLDFFLWGYLKNVIYQVEPTTPGDMKRRIVETCRNISALTFQRIENNFRNRVNLCIEANGQAFDIYWPNFTSTISA